MSAEKQWENNLVTGYLGALVWGGWPRLGRLADRVGPRLYEIEELD